MDLLDELLEHLLRDREVGDDAVFHRPDRGDVAGSLAEHLLGGQSHGLYGPFRVGSAFRADGHHRGLIQHDAASTHINQRVCGTQVDSEVGGKVGAEKTYHRQGHRREKDGVNVYDNLRRNGQDTGRAPVA
jgi:hypothetical protein